MTQRRRHRTPGPEAAHRFWTEAPLGAWPEDRTGLGAAEAARRLETEGPNEPDQTTRTGLAHLLLRKLAEPLVLILIAAAAVSGATGDLPSLVIILAIVGISIGLDTYQEQGARRAAEALRDTIALTVQVIRDGSPCTVPARAVVRGDLVQLAPGNVVPADGLVVESHAARVDEAILTGEAYPVDKGPAPSHAVALAEASEALFAGTALVSGEATMVVRATGRSTCLGRISADLAQDQPLTAFERGLHRLGLLIIRLTLALVLFVLLTQLVFHRPPLESFMFATALAVGLTPELLPMVTTVTLARGAVRMARRRVIVKRLAAIHDLGAMDVLCTDKTGTLTEARIALAAALGPDGQASARVLELAAVNSRFESGVGTPLDAALLAAAPPQVERWRRLADLPFDFERRRAAVLAEQDGAPLLIVKGAPEAVLALCRAVDSPAGPIALDAAHRATLEALHETRAGAGERLLALAWRAMPPGTTSLAAADETALVFGGFCSFLDPPKPSAAAAIARLGALGVRVKVISGDAAAVVRHLVESLGLAPGPVLTGADMDRLSQRALRQRLRDTDYFARVSPDQKLRIIHTLSHAGHTVGFMGDGINDAPAIKAADAGLSVDGATDVARAAADLILLDADLQVVADGVEEGRRTYANIMKYVRMGTSSNFGNMLSMALASVVVPFLPMTAVQILLNNLLYDVSQMGIPFDGVDRADLAAPRNWSIAAIERFTAWMGPLSSVFDLATFALLLEVFHADPATFRTAWFVESILTQLLVIFVIRTRGLPWHNRPGPILVLTVAGALSVAVAAALGPWRAVLGFGPLPGSLLAMMAGLTALYLTLAQFLKHRALDLTVRAGPGLRPKAASTW